MIQSRVVVLQRAKKTVLKVKKILNRFQQVCGRREINIMNHDENNSEYIYTVTYFKFCNFCWRYE